MATAESGGGAGGKFRKKPTRRTNSTPYDRPTTALRPTQVVGAALRENNNNSWLSKLVDPASRLITAGAHKLFSSVFRKRLLPPPPPQPQPPQPSDEATEIRDVQQEDTMVVFPSVSKEAIVSRGTLRGVTDSGGVAELENILKQKTFTRSEIDHLTALLMSRTVDGLVEAEKGTSEPGFPSVQGIRSRHEIVTNLPSLENRVECASISTPVARSKVVDDVVASPADLAKAYMGSRPARASPLVLGSHKDMPKEDLSAAYNLFSKPTPPSMSLIQRPSSDIRASDNGFMTPRFRGRSAIYSMARTPYSRLHPAKVYKAAETASDVCGASSSSHNATEIQQLSGSKGQVLKRRSSVLENDIGFVGPIRRIRQKPNLLHRKTLSVPASGSVHLKHGSEHVTNATELPPSINWSPHHHSSTKELAENGMPSTSNGYVPTKSVETAEKIFQHLDNLIRKGKSPEKKIDIVEGSSSEKRTPDVRDGLALKSRNNIESLRVLETSEGSRKGNGLLDSRNVQDCSPKVSSVEEVGKKKFPIPSVEGVSENGNPNKGLDNVIERSIFGQQQKKGAFQISAHEDYLELDDDGITNDVASTPTTKGESINDIAKNSVVIFDNPCRNLVNSDANSPAPNANSSMNFLAEKRDSSVPDIFAASHKISRFQSSFVPPSSSGTSMTSTQAAVSSPAIVAEMDKAAARSEKVNEINPNNSSSAKLAPLSFSPSCSTLEPAVSTDKKTELLHSETSAVAKVNEPGKTDKKNTLLFADASKKIEDIPSAPSATKDLLTFGSPSNSAALGNGLSSSNGGVSPTSILNSSSNDQTPNPVSLPVCSFSNGNALSTSAVASSAGPVISTSLIGKTGTLGSSSGSQVSTSIAAPPVSSGPMFQFGSSAIVSTSATFGTSALEPTTKTEAEINENQFGKFTSIPFAAKPPGTATVGNDISEVTAASPFKTGGNETPIAAAPAFPGGSIFGLQPASSSSAIAAPMSAQALSSQSASSASSSIFGLSVPTGFDASKVGNPFAPQVSISASSTPGTSTMTTPISSSSNSPTTGIFGWQSSKPAVLFGSSSQSTGFTFGSTTSGTSSAANNNATSPSVFGASSNTSSSSTPFIFGSTPSVFSAPSAVGSNPAPSTTAFPSQSTFGISAAPAQPFTFGSTPLSGNNEQMSMEDSMAEDSVQVPSPAAPVFGAPLSGPSSFVFGGAPTPTPSPTQTPTMGSPFQFGGQQTQVGSQNTPFQPSGSFELNAGGAGSFSLGSGGVDKSNRRMVRVKNRIRKK